MKTEREKLMADTFSVWLYHQPAWAKIFPVNALLWAAFRAGCELVERLEKGKE